MVPKKTPSKKTSGTAGTRGTARRKKAPAKLSPEIISKLLIFQKSELSEYYTYSTLASQVNNKKNAATLRRIADEEKKHHDILAGYTGRTVRPAIISRWFFIWLARIFGLTFGIKLLERKEEGAQINYQDVSQDVPKIRGIIADEERHEKKLIGMIEEDRLQYVGAIVLGLNDALVELTGALAGLSFALQKPKLIALVGLITGIAASLSMAASEYLSNKSDGQTKKALPSALYTGLAYIVTVLLLVLPYLVLPLVPVAALHHFGVMLACTLFIAIGIIAFFNFYISIAKDYNFKKRFFEMAGISLGVAALSFLIGVLIRLVIGVDI